MDIEEVVVRGIRFSIREEEGEVARARLYLLSNDLHDVPFGLLEDVYVAPTHRGAGAGRELVQAVLQRARAEKCYKLIATSRDDGTRSHVHEWYVRLGFRDYGTEFRIDL